MSAKSIFLLLLHLCAWLGCAWGQRSGYSLQAAVDELHRREAAKYPLNAPPATQQRYGGGAFLGGSPQEQDYWDDDADGYNGNGNSNSNNNNNNRNRHRLNKILAKYLERENYDADHGGLSLGPFGGYEFDEDNNNLFLNYPEDKKRASYFRERDNKWANGAVGAGGSGADNVSPSIFRERDNDNTNGGGDHAELTDQFLREIEESQELEREARYKDALRRLWEKYQQQENELDGNLHEEYKRMIASSPQYYMGPLMQKKRSYPVLPWLPYSSRKKRVPAMQPAVKRSPNDNANFGKTDDKVAWELSELFGNGPPNEDKKKRSTDEQVSSVATTNAPEKSTTSTTTVKTHMRLETATEGKDNATKLEPGHEHQEHAGHEGHKHAKVQNQNQGQVSHQKRKRSYHHAHGESHEECDESEEHEEHEHEEEEDEDEHEIEDIDEDEEEERKKKRDVSNASGGGAIRRRSNWEVITDDQLVPEEQGSNDRKKKSVNWSKYFGLDRKKKFSGIRDQDIMKKKRSTNEDDSELEEKKRDVDPDKLENMDKKLQAIEDMIIDDTIKYTGAHEGIANPEEIRRLKDHVLSRLATAYSLEKMRRALDKLRQSVDNENHFIRNVIENESKSDENDAYEQQKRLSVKKEKVQFDSSHNLGLPQNLEKSKELHSNAMPASNDNSNAQHNNHNDNPDSSDNEDMKKKKKKRTNSYLRYPEVPNDFTYFEPELNGAGRYESLNDAYLGNKNYVIGSNQCPLIESMAERCRNVDLLSGDIHQELLPICGVHQICYLCGTSQIACDYQYLAEADVICGHSNDCQAAARSVLMILRGTPGTQLGPKECLKNPCLYSAMREIGL